MQLFSTLSPIACLLIQQTSSLLIPNPGLQNAPGMIENHGDIVYCGNIDEVAFKTTGDPEDGPGFWITNQDDDPDVMYFLYENSRDEHAWKYLSLPQGSRAFVQVCPTWQGRVVRGIPRINTDNTPHNLGTWFKSSIDPALGWMWGDISFLEGCDGGGRVSSTDTDGSNTTRSCMIDLLTDAPPAALVKKDSGNMVIAKTVGVGANDDARGYETGMCSPDEVWIDVANTHPVIKSMNGRLEFVFYKGRA
ncbi:hypothetical protein F5Y18DRAFT_443680 [Xylariaceae sp. FL1019]|nr:hypothetical protein F5Y18DRAFT_443680 [Xylariaceae sp. FL1019]